MLKRLKTDFISSVLILVSGTVLAQLISYLLSPIISRLYTPEDMTYLSLFSRIVSFLAVIATVRFELAFPLPKREEHAFSLYRLSLTYTVVTVALSLFAVAGLMTVYWEDVNMYFLLAMIPFGILFLAFYNQGLSWAIRTKNFKSISISKVFSSSFNAVSAVVLGLIPFGYRGLIIGYLLGNLSSVLPYMKSFFKVRSENRSFLLKGRSYAMAKSYVDFPLINLPHALIDFSKELFIAFYLVYTFEKDILGLYDFSYRMLKLPIGLIGIAIGQVFYTKAADKLNEGQSIHSLVKQTLFTLVGLSIVPFALLFVWGDELFAFVFGEPWRRAGEFSQIMSPWLMVNFIISPLSQVPTLLKKQGAFILISFFGTILMVLCLTAGDIFPHWNMKFEDVLKLVSVSQFIFLTGVVIWILWLTGKYSNKAMS